MPPGGFTKNATDDGDDDDGGGGGDDDAIHECYNLNDKYWWGDRSAPKVATPTADDKSRRNSPSAPQIAIKAPRMSPVMIMTAPAIINATTTTATTTTATSAVATIATIPLFAISYKKYNSNLVDLLPLISEPFPLLSILTRLDALISASSAFQPATNSNIDPSGLTTTYLESVCPREGGLRSLSFLMKADVEQFSGCLKITAAPTAPSNVFTSSSFSSQPSWWASLESRESFLSMLTRSFTALRLSSPTILSANDSLLLLEGELLLRDLEEEAFRSALPTTRNFALLLGDILPKIEEAVVIADSAAFSSSAKWLPRALFLLGRSEYVLWLIGGGEGDAGFCRRLSTFGGEGGCEEESFFGRYHSTTESYRRFVMYLGMTNVDDTNNCVSSQQVLPAEVFVRYEDRCLQFYDKAIKVLSVDPQNPGKRSGY